MNESFYNSVISDRKREVSRLVEENQALKHIRESAEKKRDSLMQKEHAQSWWRVTAGRMIKGIYTLINEGGF